MPASIFDFMEKSCLYAVRFLFTQSIFITILFIVIFLLTSVLKKKSPSWQLGLWSLILIRLVLPTDFSLPFSAGNLFKYNLFSDKIQASVEEVSGMLVTGNKYALNNESRGLRLPDRHPEIKNKLDRSSSENKNIFFSLPILLLMAWSSGALFFLCIFIRKIHCIENILKSAVPVRDKETVLSVEYWRKSFGIERPVEVFSSSKFLSPFTSGLFHPKIYIPEHILRSGFQDTVNSIIAHEMVHIRHFDHGWIRLQNLLQIIYFFHPALWYANMQINMARERICDSRVLGTNTITPALYGRSIIDVLRLNVSGNSLLDPQLCFSNHKKIFESRIKDILKTGSAPMKKTKSIFIMTCLSGLFLLPMSGGQMNTAKIIAGTENKDIEFIRPMKGDITSRYGERMSPFNGQTEFHHGIDIAAKWGTPVFAAASGTVIKVVFTEEKEHQVSIGHNGNFQTNYAQCKKILVKEGQSVNSGSIIATCGSSGRSTGPHLHFEVIKDGNSVNPEDFIEKVTAALETDQDSPEIVDSKKISSSESISGSLSAVVNSDVLSHQNISKAGTDKKPENNTGEYIVKSGDSLWKIADRFGTTVKTIKIINNLKNSQLHVSQRLLISSDLKLRKSGISRKYRVRNGDSPYRIAKRYRMSLNNFLRLNNLTQKSTIYPGQMVRVIV